MNNFQITSPPVVSPRRTGFCALPALFAGCLLLASQGCSVAPPEVTRAVYQAKQVDLRSYNSARIMPATVTAAGAPANLGQTWAQVLAEEMKDRKLFPEISVGNPTGSPSELVVSTAITECVSSIRGRVTLSSSSARDIYSYPIDHYAGGFGAIGTVGAVMADARTVLKGSAAVCALTIDKTKRK